MAIRSNIGKLVPLREKLKTTIKLLSGKYFEPTLFADGALTVYPWDSSVDEWVIERAKKGNTKSIPFELLTRLCDLKGVDYRKFPYGEVDTVLFVARALNHASKLKFTAVCPACEHKWVEEVVVPDNLEKIGEKGPDYLGYDDVTLAESTDVVRIRPLLVGDVHNITTRTNKSIPESTAMLISTIVSINGTTPDSPEECHAYLLAITVADRKALEAAVEATTPHLSKTLRIECPECGHEFSHQLRIDEDFFR